MRARRLAHSILTALVLAGCASLQPRAPEPLTPEVHRLLDALHGRWARFEDLRGVVDVTVRRGDRGQRLSGVLLLKSPDSMRLEALSPWGQPFLILASTGSSFALYQVTENRAYLGPASARALERWLGIPLEPSELVGALSGYIPPLKNPVRGTLMPPDEAGPSLELAGPERIQRIWFDPATLVVRQAEWSGNGSRLRVIYDGAGADGVPTGLRMEAPEEKTTVSIRYRKAELGVGIRHELFRLDLPEDAKVRRFD